MACQQRAQLTLLQWVGQVGPMYALYPSSCRERDPAATRAQSLEFRHAAEVFHGTPWKAQETHNNAHCSLTSVMFSLSLWIGEVSQDPERESAPCI